MRCHECGHWNSCPRCNEYLCEECGAPLDEPEPLDEPLNFDDSVVLNDTIRRQLDVN